MDLEYKFGKTKVDMKDHFIIINKTGMQFYDMVMEMFMTGIGEMIIIMDKVN